MGKNNKNGKGYYEWEDDLGEEASQGDEETPYNGHGNGYATTRGESSKRNQKSVFQNDSRSTEEQEPMPNLQVQPAEPDFGPYLQAVEEFKTQMIAGQKAMKNVHASFTKQQHQIRDAVGTHQRLLEMTKQCKEYRIAYKVLQNEEKKKEEKLAREAADITKEREVLDKAKKETERYKEEVQEEKEKFGRRVKTTEAEQQLKLEELRRSLEKELNEKYAQQVKDLERGVKKGQEDDRKRIAALETENAKLTRGLDEQKGKVRQIETNLKHAEDLRTHYEEMSEKLKQELKMAENEFGLGTVTTDSYKRKFAKIQKDIQTISFETFRELNIGNLKETHDRIEVLDADFNDVPISTSELSSELRVVHAQRVISAHLQEVIWQPFSCDVALQSPGYTKLFNQISKGLVESSGKSTGGFRAARLCAALTMRGLQSQSSPSKQHPLSVRAEAFADKVMAILSLLITQPLHRNLKNKLLDLATSAIAVWNDAQTDEREVIVSSDLDPTTIDGWHEDILESHNGVIVLFPRIIARTYSRRIDSRPAKGPPGGWVENPIGPEEHFEETCIYAGEGLGKWSDLVMQGEEEEDERKMREEEREVEEQKRILVENLKQLEKPKRKLSMSHSMKESSPGAASKPSALWMKGGGNRINEGND